jgi:hypothetical protein
MQLNVTINVDLLEYIALKNGQQKFIDFDCDTE